MLNLNNVMFHNKSIVVGDNVDAVDVVNVVVVVVVSAKQRDELEGSLADLYTSCEFVEKALTHGSETEILLVKKQVSKYNIV